MPTIQFPYTFATRNADFQRGLPPFHDKLSSDRCDIAFEVEWTALSPIAANPCTASGPSCAPENLSKSYAGYDKRWLVIDGKLAISPFTVKSAIANGFANILGGCYRVNSEIVPHAPVESGQYPYTGAYKRYRVDMGGQSKPGIVIDKKKITGKGYEFTIQCAKEFYLDESLPKGINPGDKVFATIKDDRRHRPSIISTPVSMPTGIKGEIPVIYLGPFQYGMNLNKTHRRHRHRFIQLQQKTITGIVTSLNFERVEQQATVVYMGQYNNDPAVRWFEDLNRLHPGSWVYYEEFNGKITHIGQNFLFKALFCHSDTIPPNQQTCTELDNLCPRCQMYGITVETDDRENQPSGYRGRFKASTLVSTETLTAPEKLLNQRIPYDESPDKFINVDLLQWKSGGKVVARQFLMPIAGPPKPNKRDIKGYFDPKTGFLKGPKKYLHGSFGVTDLHEWKHTIETIDDKTETDPETNKFIYAHKLRNYAVVCESGTTFTGTIGAENCSPDEAAALLMLLETEIADDGYKIGHGYKIGLGKSWGLGSVSSAIKRIWIRKPDSDGWDYISCNDTPIENILPELEMRLKGVTNALNVLKNVQDIGRKLNSVEGHEEKKLEFPRTLREYWKEASRAGLNG